MIRFVDSASQTEVWGLGPTPEATKQFIDYMQTVNPMTRPAPMGGMMGGGIRGCPPRAPGEGGDRR